MVSSPVKNLHPVQKAAILHSVGYSLLGLPGIFYLTDIAVRFFLKRVRPNPIEMRSLIANGAQQHRSKFTAHIASAFTYISLLMYSSSGQLCLSLLHCVPVGDEQVLFLDGNIRCYQTFQYYILVYVVSSVLPFCLVPVLDSYLLKMDRISVSQFCVACLFPLPFCCFWSYLLLKGYHTRKKSSNDTAESERAVRGTADDDLIEHCEGQMNGGQDSIEYEHQCHRQDQGQCQAICVDTAYQRTSSMSESEETGDHEITQIIRQCSQQARQHRCCQATLHEYEGERACEETNLNSRSGETTTSGNKTAILRVLLGPFRTHKAFLCFPGSHLPWEGYLIFRRLALTLVLTFVHGLLYNRLKMMLSLTLCVAILASHTYIKPFSRQCDNAIESLSLSTLTVLCGFTLIKSLYDGEDVSSSEDPALLHYFKTFENIVVVAPLVFLVFLVVLSVFGRLLLLLRKCLIFCRR